MISNITAGNPEQIQAVINENLVPLVVNILVNVSILYFYFCCLVCIQSSVSLLDVLQSNDLLDDCF